MRLTPLIFCMIMLLALPVRAQETAQFEMDAVVVRGEEASRNARVDVYVSVPYNRLTFLSTADGFTAEYEVTADAYRADDRNRKRGLAQTRIWQEKVVTNLFARTRSDLLQDQGSNAMDLPPGRYVLDVQLRDRASGSTYSQSQPLVVRNLDRRLALSDIVLLQDYRADDRAITPLIGGRVGTDAGSFKLFYEVYSDGAKEVSVSQQVRRLTGGSQGFVRSILGLGRDDEEEGDVTFQREEPRRLTAGRNPSIVDIPMSDLKAGDYVVRVEVRDEAGRPIDVVERAVAVRWSGLDEHIRDLDEAIAQLQYIAKRKEIDHITSGGDRGERLERFLAFWEKRDPTPRTTRNERMEEYYYRIDFANRRFTNLRDGWKTDRGHVMVLFGEPDFIESPLNSSVRPYEVWYYYRIGRRFVFLDRNSLGDYELMVPIWDERTRIR